eukprot:scaffold1681_cov242-Prasinococcus_capsulatus_cf.AAC.7
MRRAAGARNTARATAGATSASGTAAAAGDSDGDSDACGRAGGGRVLRAPAAAQPAGVLRGGVHRAPARHRALRGARRARVADLPPRAQGPQEPGAPRSARALAPSVPRVAQVRAMVQGNDSYIIAGRITRHAARHGAARRGAGRTESCVRDACES